MSAKDDARELGIYLRAFIEPLTVAAGEVWKRLPGDSLEREELSKALGHLDALACEVGADGTGRPIFTTFKPFPGERDANPHDLLEQLFALALNLRMDTERRLNPQG